MSSRDEAFEPSADARAFGQSMMDNFQGLLAAGFSEQQALQILGTALSAAIIGGAT